MQVIFQIMRVLAGLASVAGLGIIGLIVLIRSAAVFIKESAGVLRYVAELFASAFTKGEQPPEPSGWVIALPQAGLAVLFIAMLAAEFLPQERLYQHVVAAFAGAATIWLLVLLFLSPRMEILCLPPLLVWGIYYVLSFWKK